MGKYDELIRAHSEQAARDSSLYENALEGMREMMVDEERVADLFANADKAILDIDSSFRRATGLNKTDARFLMLATALQIVRWVVVAIIKREVSQKISDSRVAHDDKSIKEMEKEKRNEFKEKHEEKHGHVKSKEHRDWANIVFDSVPYDITRGSKVFGVNMEGGYHRIHTLGHDPLLGWVFGTVNILSDTITLDRAYEFQTYDVEMMAKPKRWTGPSSFAKAFADAVDSVKEDDLRLAAAVLAQGIHLKSDAFTKLGLPVPILEAISSDYAGKIYKEVKKNGKVIKEGYDTLCLVRDIAAVGVQAVSAIIINMIIASVHGLFYDPQKDKCLELYEVKTRKILSISNAIASASNVIWVGGNAWMGNKKAWADLDIGGMLVTAYRLVTDIRFISRVQKDYLENEWMRMAAGSEYRFTLEAEMGKKDVEKGIEIQAKADAAAHKKVADGLAHQADALEQIKDSQQSMHDIVGTVLKDVKDMQAQLKYGIEPGRMPKDLASDEGQVLCSALYSLMESEGSVNELQRELFLAVEQQVGAIRREGGFDFSKLGNVDSHSDRMLILEALCSFLFLKDEDFSFMDDKAYAWLRHFAVGRDLEYVRNVISQEYATVGPKGVSARYAIARQAISPEPEPVSAEEADHFPAGDEEESGDVAFERLREIILSYVEDEKAFGKSRNDSPQQAMKEVTKQYPDLDFEALVHASKVEGGYLLFTTHAIYLKAEPIPRGGYARIPYAGILVNELSSELGRIKGTRKLVIPVDAGSGEKITYAVDNSRIEEERLRDLIKEIRGSGCTLADTDFSLNMPELDEGLLVLYFRALGNMMLRSGMPLTELYLIVADFDLKGKWDEIAEGFEGDDELDTSVSKFLQGIPYPSGAAISYQAVLLALQTICRTNAISGKTTSAIPDQLERLVRKFDTQGFDGERLNEMLKVAAESQRPPSLNTLYDLRERLPKNAPYRNLIESGIPALEEAAQKAMQGADGPSNPIIGIAQSIGGFLTGLTGARGEELKLPDEYQSLGKKFPENAGVPKGAKALGMRTGSASALLVCFPVSESESMPFDDNQSIIEELHETLGDAEGIVEVGSGETANGKPFVYDIIKHRGEEELGVNYILNVNVRMARSIQFINGDFAEEGVTGIRDNLVYTMFKNASSAMGDERCSDAVAKWAADPYNPEYERGFLMSQSEKAAFDEQFPEHPLSEARRLIRYIVENN